MFSKVELLIFGENGRFAINLFTHSPWNKVINYYLGEYDPAEIHNAGQLRKHMIHVSLHLAWQMVSFFIYLYW